MEGRRNSGLRTVTRRYEPHRLEEQVWAMAYEHIWPVFRRVLKSPQPASRIESVQKAIEPSATVRSA